MLRSLDFGLGFGICRGGGASMRSRVHSGWVFISATEILRSFGCPGPNIGGGGGAVVKEGGGGGAVVKEGGGGGAVVKEEGGAVVKEGGGGGVVVEEGGAVVEEIGGGSIAGPLDIQPTETGMLFPPPGMLCMRVMARAL